MDHHGRFVSRLVTVLKFFLIYLSRLPIRLTEKRRKSVRVTADSCGLSEGRGMTKILLVEDSKFLRMAMERALARAGYEVIAAEDGVQAIETVQKEKPDLILLDMLLPKMGGQDVLAQLKKNPATAGIAVVACTGLSQKNEARLKHDGICAFLDKSQLGLDKGSGHLLAAVAGILRELNLEVPSSACAVHV